MPAGLRPSEAIYTRTHTHTFTHTGKTYEYRVPDDEAQAHTHILNMFIQYIYTQTQARRVSTAYPMISRRRARTHTLAHTYVPRSQHTKERNARMIAGWPYSSTERRQQHMHQQRRVTCSGSAWNLGQI